MKQSEALRILGLSNGADDDAVKVAHRKKVVESHPDKFAHGSAEYAQAEEKTKLINEARDVLLSRKWEPEYTQRGTSANPYSNPYARPYGGGSYAGSGGAGGSSRSGQDSNPYQGWPFGQDQAQTAWVWTSWDGVAGQEGTSFNPFGYTREQKTPEERKIDATKGLRNESLVISLKAFVLSALSLTGAFPFGLFIYVIVSVFYGAYKRVGNLIPIFIVPVLVLSIPLLILIMPLAGSLTFGLVIAGVLAVAFDVRNLRKRFAAYKASLPKASS